ncbi:MAG: ribonuclease H [Candidatus Dactylopiibacterium carminicum]|uniref:Ribonuclease H n=1 Tax=Candidatus Dactylopiibacterium carminicum TaxID=857335 RepID=A0A272EU95_9RHOO|nr:reverse transcriptase-like protein [Candidatus Dactylopiibacterium carminicum]KAF7599330.1 ribonuclease H [Candidatus Dactylopiibacterium carminicum]PAS93320.1 MAG: ribonuclease H [Candidatus Dactylopiibacterium carminicum]PAS94343.1 MAG: ribonuclease H [Candidatus Dactylopiibacterium carminicum]PAS99333.1 MAG: hypothetical protein BSR46_08665 [Candidatus Dactylopiibacterium carminicum]
MSVESFPGGEVWFAWCDGCALPNPGRIGLGGVLLAPDQRRHEFSEAAGRSGCNNEAEARALLSLLRHAKALGARALVVHSDSDVVVRLAPLFAELREAMRAFVSLELKWLPQHRNQQADGLARAALGLPPRAPAKPRNGRSRR